MTEDEAYLIVRMADAIGEEGIWHWIEALGQDEADARVLGEAVRIAWGRMDDRQRENLGPGPDGQ